MEPMADRREMVSKTFEIYRTHGVYPGEKVPHHHDFYEMFLFVSSKADYTVEGRRYRLNQGDLLLISPMELHQPMVGTDCRDYDRYILRIDRTYLEQYAKLGDDLTQCFNTRPPEHSDLLRPDSVSMQELVYLLEQMAKEQGSQEFASDLNGQTYLIQTMVLVNRLAMRTPKQPEIRDKSEPMVTSVVNYINAHYDEELSLDILANHFYISKYYLSREFSRLVGTSVHRYITQKRLVMAKYMMNEGASITTAYQHCGFGDYSNFYRAFKSEYRISPKEYINTLKEDALRGEELAKERARLHREPGG